MSQNCVSVQHIVSCGINFCAQEINLLINLLRLLPFNPVILYLVIVVPANGFSCEFGKLLGRVCPRRDDDQHWLPLQRLGVETSQVQRRRGELFHTCREVERGR